MTRQVSQAMQESGQVLQLETAMIDFPSGVFRPSVSHRTAGRSGMSSSWRAESIVLPHSPFNGCNLSVLCTDSNELYSKHWKACVYLELSSEQGRTWENCQRPRHGSERKTKSSRRGDDLHCPVGINYAFGSRALICHTRNSLFIQVSARKTFLSNITDTTSKNSSCISFIAIDER